MARPSEVAKLLRRKHGMCAAELAERLNISKQGAHYWLQKLPRHGYKLEVTQRRYKPRGPLAAHYRVTR